MDRPERYYYEDAGWIHLGFPPSTQLAWYVTEKMKCKYNNANKEYYCEFNIATVGLIKELVEREGFVKGRFTPPSDFELKELPPPEVTEEEVMEMCRDLRLGKQPRPYQIEAITYQINHGGDCINGAQPGVGKTITEIYYVELTGSFPCLVICPSTVKMVWRNEWKSVNPDRSLSILDAGNKVQDFTADVIVTNYEFLFERAKEVKGAGIPLRFEKEMRKKKFRCALVDEVHFCKNQEAQRTRAVRKITRQIPDVEVMSGTLVQSRPKELISIMKIVKRFKDIFPDLSYFYDRYCNRKFTFFGQNIDGHSNTEELNMILKHYCYTYKDKREVLKDLPPLTEQYIETECRGMREYRKAEKDLIDYLERFEGSSVQAAMDAQSLVRISTLKGLSVNGKIPFITKFLQEWLEGNGDDRILVFGIRKTPLKELHAMFPKDSLLITGDDGLGQKQEKIRMFAKRRILFANIQTIGTGVDGLQDLSSTMAFIEYPDNPDMMQQAVSRLERSGQKNAITVYHLMCSETIDASQWEMLQYKRKVADTINKGSFTSTRFEGDFNKAIIDKLKKN